MQKKYADKGVVILALSYEPSEKVQKFLKDYTAEANKKSEGEKQSSFEFNYIVGMGAEAAKSAYKVTGYPTILVVDAKGKVTYRGHNPNEAEDEIKRLLEKDPPKNMLTLTEAAAKKLYRKAAGYAKKKQYEKALKAFEECAEQFKSSNYGKKAESKVKRIRGDKKIMARINETESEKECKDWLRLARSCVKAGQKETALEYYDKIIQKYPDSDHAKTARAEKAKV